MKARDLYGLAIRIGGLVFFVYAGFDATHVIAAMAGVPIPGQYSLADLKLATASYATFGLVMTFGAGLLVRAVYGPDKSN
jgi:hypothetical protein